MNTITQIKDPVIKKNLAIERAGNASKLAKILDISRASVSDWGEYVPSYQAYRILQVFPDIQQD